MAWTGNAKILVVVVLMAVICLSGVTAEDGEARAISNFFSSKLGDLYKLRQSFRDATMTTATPTTTTTTTTTTSVPSHPSSMLGWSSRREGNSAFQGLLSLSDGTDDLQIHLSPESGPTEGQMKTVQYWKAANSTLRLPSFTPDVHENSRAAESVLEDHWTRVKGIFENMKSILQEMYPDEGSDGALGFSVFGRAIAFGDQMYFLKDMISAFDPGLLEYLSAKWSDVKTSLIHTHPLLRAALSSNTQELGWSLLTAVMRQMGGIMHRQAFIHFGDLDFVIHLMRSSGFRDEEIRKVFELLDLPTAALDDGQDMQAESRQLAGYGTYTLDKSGGYGHSGGYGGGGGGGYGHMGGGYGYMQSFDPFVLLAGLAFATFLAYLIYRLLSSTGGGKRSIPDTSLALDMSDLPVIMDNLYSGLEEAQMKYEDVAKSLLQESNSLSSAANHLWDNYQVDRLSRACVRRFLCDYVTSSNNLVTSTSLMEQLALTSLAQLFGEESTGAFLDQISSRLIDGNDVQCGVVVPQCDDEAYRRVPSDNLHASSSLHDPSSDQKQEVE